MRAEVSQLPRGSLAKKCMVVMPTLALNCDCCPALNMFVHFGAFFS